MPVAKRILAGAGVPLHLTGKTDLRRQRLAPEWLEWVWARGNGSLSWQVLPEFHVDAAAKTGVPPRDARFLIGAFLEWHPVDSSPRLPQRARHWIDTSNLSCWDALILAAAEIAGCGFLPSEDFQTGRRYGSVQVISPILAAPESLPPSMQ
jgi:predicted nucleic acid-binding protein